VFVVQCSVFSVRRCCSLLFVARCPLPSTDTTLLFSVFVTFPAFQSPFSHQSFPI
jgi:hypothetical protein